MFNMYLQQESCPFLYFYVPHISPHHVYMFCVSMLVRCWYQGFILVIFWFVNNNYSWRLVYVQGLRELRAKSLCLLLGKYECQWHFEPTGGSPDVVHLTKYAPLVFGWFPQAYRVLEAKDTDLRWGCWRMSPLLKQFFHLSALWSSQEWIKKKK